MKKRYALIGVGGRGFGMFARPIVEDFGDVADLVGLCDVNQHRLDLANSRLSSDIPMFTDLPAMLAAVRPDVVIVSSVDATHARFVVGALEAGCDVLSEKPMATTAADIRAILNAERRTGRKVAVTFNARYGAPTEKVCELLRDGVIGDVLSAEFTEFLDTSHGADYFRRWHRQKGNSGGLLVHKATHHFDQLNWWIGSAPQVVSAMGGRRFYGPTRAERGDRCLDCRYAQTCEFYLDLRANDKLRELYLEAEAEDGYYRDRCVFADDIDIEDSLVVAIRYENGVLVSYFLNAFAPFEGQRIGFSGTGGRLEIDLVGTYHGLDDTGAVSVHPLGLAPVVKVNPLFGRPYEVPVETRTGGHGGADERIRSHLFREDAPDPLSQRAGALAGAMSALIGVAANQSIAQCRPVEIKSLLQE